MQPIDLPQTVTQPILTDRYKTVTPLSDSSSLRGTARMLHYARSKGYLKDSSSPANKKNLSRLERDVVPGAVLNIMKFMDAPTRGSFLRTTRFFLNLKEASLRGRGDLVSKILKSQNGNIQSLHVLDRIVLYKIAKTITSLHLSDIELTPEQLEEIVRFFPQLQEIELRQWDDDHLDKLLPLTPYLSSLVLRDLSTNFTGVISEEFTSLKRLTIEGLMDVEVPHLGNLSQLEFLSIELCSGAALTKESVEVLGEKLKNLQVLHFPGPFHQNAFLPISLFQNLRELSIYPPGRLMYEMHDQVFMEIGKLTNLIFLKIKCCTKTEIEKPLEHLSHLKRLEKLYIKPPLQCSIESFESFLKSFPYLKELQIILCIFKNLSRRASGEKLFEIVAQNCKGLKNLRFIHTKGLGNKFHQLASLPELETIAFEYDSVGNSIFKSLDQFPKLKKLGIFMCKRITQDDVDNTKASQKRMPEIEFREYEEDKDNFGDSGSDSDSGDE